jgi:hypothetical protein
MAEYTKATRTLGQKQRAFAWAIGRLMAHAESLGYQLTFGDSYRDPRAFGEFGKKKRGVYGHSRSLHKLRLAVDFNLFTAGANGQAVYRTKTSDHQALGEFWEQLGKDNGLPLAWGGRFGDGNHYSFEHQGRK